MREKTGMIPALESFIKSWSEMVYAVFQFKKEISHVKSYIKSTTLSSPEHHYPEL